jgi:hypothetical protein
MSDAGYEELEARNRQVAGGADIPAYVDDILRDTADALADLRRQRDRARANAEHWARERDEARCPIGLDNNPELCSAGCCFVCVTDALADLRRQATQDALALREAIRQRDEAREAWYAACVRVEAAERERDCYKALAEGASGDRP